MQLQSYQSILNYQHLHTELSNEFLLIRSYQDLLHLHHLLFLGYPANIFPNIPATNLPNSIPRKPAFCLFASF